MKYLAAFLFCLPAFAAADAAQDLKSRLDEIQSLKGNFSQVLTDKAGANLQSSAGEFIVKRPGYFLWQSAAPYEQTVIGTPEKVWIYDPDLEQVTIRDSDHQADNSPARLLSGDLSDLRSSYEVAMSAGTDEAFRLMPRDAESPYRFVEFTFAGKNLVGLRFQDKLDQETDIRFKDVQLNSAVAPETFVFTPPEGTDVIVDE